ncbi:MAG: diguanylate cyclase [Acholeplasmatales bacterium]|nr:MAG: diguanylate cyclase [Acholeplasmatales bacterium]
MHTWREHKSYYVLTVLFFVLFIVSSLLYVRIAKTSKLQYLRQYNEGYADQIDITIDFYEQFSEFLFYHLIDETVIEIMHEAYHGDAAVRDTQRALLLAYLQEDYDLITQYDFRQLHFHLPDGESFLRLHQPDTYGDNLWEARASIRIVNSEGRVAKGFEEGRVYNGYRFVYPLRFDETHIGSVEISISIATLIDMLYTIQPEKAHFFLIQRDVVEGLVFENFFENYVQSVLSKQYMYDNAVNAQFNDRRTLFQESLALVSFFRDISEAVSPLMESDMSFYYVTRYNGVRYTLQFISIQNIENRHVGYVFTLFEDREYQRMVIEDRINVSMIFVIYALAYAGALIYVKDKRRFIKLSRLDGLTDLQNRRAFNAVTHREFERAKRNHQPLSLMVMDIDHFKRVNDAFGHLQGDTVLKVMADLLKGCIRQHDELCRWGGEEFALLLPQTDKDEAIKVARRIQAALKDQKLGIDKDITLSFGIASLAEDMTTIDALFRKADNRLYHAKETGRNKIVSSDETEDHASSSTR